jgi:hypothetical protein
VPPISFTPHARAEAARRDISLAVAEAVARSPEQRWLVRPGRELRQSRIVDPASGKLQLLRVFVDVRNGGEVIVTLYRTSKIRKYWRPE